MSPRKKAGPSEDVSKGLAKIEKICDRLYDSDDGHKGDIPGIMSRLDKVNGNITDLKNCDSEHDRKLDIIEERQKNVFPRVIMGLPKWAQTIIALSVLGALTNLGLGVKQVISFFVGG